METVRLSEAGIQIEMVDVTPDEVEKLRVCFTKLINAQVHRMKNGKVILHFDGDGNFRKLEVHHTIWNK